MNFPKEAYLISYPVVGGEIIPDEMLGDPCFLLEIGTITVQEIISGVSLPVSKFAAVCLFPNGKISPIALEGVIVKDHTEDDKKLFKFNRSV